MMIGRLIIGIPLMEKFNGSKGRCNECTVPVRSKGTVGTYIIFKIPTYLSYRLKP